MSATIAFGVMLLALFAIWIFMAIREDKRREDANRQIEEAVALAAQARSDQPGRVLRREEPTR